MYSIESKEKSEQLTDFVNGMSMMSVPLPNWLEFHFPFPPAVLIFDDGNQMIKAIHFPIELSGQELDQYLAKGWFRMGQTIFTTDFIPVEGRIHPVYWLRFPLQQVSFGKKQRRLLDINRDLTTRVRPFSLSDELEELYSIYRSNVDFDAPPTVESYLLDGEFNNLYDSSIVEVRDKGELVAAGIFDQGETSMAGIMNFFLPAYKSRSPGKFLMLMKILYGQKAGKLFYYPGYIASGFPKFDYKLFPDAAAAQVFDTRREEWLSYSTAINDRLRFEPGSDLSRQ